jgi:hypothetical protein
VKRRFQSGYGVVTARPLGIRRSVGGRGLRGRSGRTAMGTAGNLCAARPAGTEVEPIRARCRPRGSERLAALSRGRAAFGEEAPRKWGRA